MVIKRFFQNEKGEWVLYQHPNLLLIAWAIVTVVNIATKQSNQALSILSRMLLFAWAYQEVRYGDSPFRRTLGGVIALAVIVGLFV